MKFNMKSSKDNLINYCEEAARDNKYVEVWFQELTTCNRKGAIFKILMDARDLIEDVALNFDDDLRDNFNTYQITSYIVKGE